MEKSKGMGGSDISGEDSAANTESKNPLQSSKGHKSGLLDEKFQQGDKPKASSLATAGIKNRDEDAADPEFAKKGTSKGFDRDQQELALGLDDGDLDNDR